MSHEMISSIYHDGYKLSFCAAEPGIVFDPSAYKFIPHTFSSVCRMGFFCEYRIKDGELYLDKLCIDSSNNKYPDLNGVSAKPFSTDPAYSEYHLYEGVMLKVPYTGIIVAGAGPDKQFIRPAEHQYPWVYEKVFTFAFKDGVLTGVCDKSFEAYTIRLAQIAELKAQTTTAPEATARENESLLGVIEQLARIKDRVVIADSVRRETDDAEDSGTDSE